MILNWFNELFRDNRDERFDETYELLLRGGFEVAIEKVERIVRLKPNNSRFRSRLAMFYLEAANERLSSGLSDLSSGWPTDRKYKAEEILSCISPDDFGIGSSKTTYRLIHSNPDEDLRSGLEMYDKSIKLSPEAPAYLARARAFHTLADHLLRSFGVFPDYESHHTQEPQAETFKAGSVCLSRMSGLKGSKPPDLATKVLWMYGHAEVDYIKASEIDPTNAETYLGLSHVQRQQERVIQADSNRDKALLLLNRAISVDDSDSESYFSRAKVFEEIGELTLAATDFEKVLTLPGSEFQLYIAKSRIKKLRAKVSQ
jgi:tetratricopeptide (TPR) repeat protein